MSDSNASEIFDRKVEKLIQEKLTLNARLRNLRFEQIPHLNTRTQKYRSAQIEGTRARLGG